MNETLIKLAKHLGQEKITWGIGGSMLLKKCGFACNPNDLDIS